MSDISKAILSLIDPLTLPAKLGGAPSDYEVIRVDDKTTLVRSNSDAGYPRYARKEYYRVSVERIQS